MMSKVIVELTEIEAKTLSMVSNNGWGDGDFADWLSKEESKACIRAMDKLDAACIQASSSGE